MDIIISDKEKEDLKARIVSNVETRMTAELMHAIERSATREVVRRVWRFNRSRLAALAKDAVTEERVRSAIDKILVEMSEKRQYQDESSIRKMIEATIFRVVNAHAEAVGGELKNLLYVALRYGFYRKEDGLPPPAEVDDDGRLIVGRTLLSPEISKEIAEKVLARQKPEP